jgi:hypothetical protein
MGLTQAHGNIPMNQYSNHSDEHIKIKKMAEISNLDFHESEEEEDFSLFDETFEILHHEAVDLRRKADQLFELNIISEKEYLEFITYLERQETIIKQYDDY